MLIHHSNIHSYFPLLTNCCSLSSETETKIHQYLMALIIYIAPINAVYVFHTKMVLCGFVYSQYFIHPMITQWSPSTRAPGSSLDTLTVLPLHSGMSVQYQHLSLHSFHRSTVHAYFSLSPSKLTGTSLFLTLAIMSFLQQPSDINRLHLRLLFFVHLPNLSTTY